MKVIIDNDYGWKYIRVGKYNVQYIGNYKYLKTLIKSIVALGSNPSHEKIDNILSRLTMPTAVIIESVDVVIAFTDYFRSYPLFYSNYKNGFISNSARKINELIGGGEWDRLSSRELIMTGYVTGSKTLIKGLNQLQSGERMIVNISNDCIDISRYYRYQSIDINESRSDSDWVDELDEVMNNVTKRMIKHSNGRRIQVPLSAGLDSRLIVCKLHEAGYDNLQTFSYGSPNNWESRGAKMVANRLNIKWKSITTDRKEARRMFWSEDRKKYWKFADGLSALPNFQEYYPLLKMNRNKDLSEDDIIINGQSGDFISGGHLPIELTNNGANIQSLTNIILNKHYALWKNLMNEETLKIFEKKIVKLMGVNTSSKLTSSQLLSLYEQWECEERQSKWVIHGQRVYDYFGYDWHLPLWDIELVRFFQRVPYHLKFDQCLYKLWLQRWNYKKLFVDFDPIVWQWPGLKLSVVPMAKVTQLLFGNNAKKSFYELLYYWGHTSEQYAPYTYSEYLKNMKYIRNSISMNGYTWAKENSLPLELDDFGENFYKI
jgi:asparagine synthase (glutamine-hydrolysing)